MIILYFYLFSPIDKVIFPPYNKINKVFIGEEFMAVKEKISETLDELENSDRKSVV